MLTLLYIVMHNTNIKNITAEVIILGYPLITEQAAIFQAAQTLVQQFSRLLINNAVVSGATGRLKINI